jgi:uncharacterized protein (TIGR02266 family)
MSEGLDKRKFKRLSTSWIVRIRTRKPTDTTRVRFDERIRNVSLGGVFIETRYPFRVGSIVEFDFNMPGHPELIHAKGMVRWSNDGSMREMPLGMGIEFLEVSSLARDAIHGYVEGQAGGDLLGPLTASEEHRALLKFYKQKLGQTFKLDGLSALLGMAHERLIALLSDFALYDLVGFQGDDVQFKKSGDAKLERAVEEWKP